MGDSGVDARLHESAGRLEALICRMEATARRECDCNLSQLRSENERLLVGRHAANYACFAGFVTVVGTMISSSGAASKSKALHERGTEMTVKETA